MKIRNRNISVGHLFVKWFVVILAGSHPLNNKVFAQDTIKTKQTITTSTRKPEETITSPPSLSSLLTQTVVFIYEDKTPQNSTSSVPGRVLGTAFIVGVPLPEFPELQVPFIVTAKHVLADSTKVMGRFTTASGGEPAFASYDLNALRQSGDLWEYPNDEGVDIVIFRTVFFQGIKMLPIPLNMLASKDTFVQEQIEVADRIVIPCLMGNYPGITKNYPIFRDGSIALINEEPIAFSWNYGSKKINTRQRMIFVNSTLNEGFSGAPAFLWPGIKLTSKGTVIGGKPILIGIVHGFFPQYRPIIDTEGEPVILKKQSPGVLGQLNPARDVPVISQENSATGILFPSWQILDILQTDSVKKRVQEIAEEEKKKRENKLDKKDN